MEYGNIIEDYVYNNSKEIIEGLKAYKKNFYKTQKRIGQIKNIFSDLQITDPYLYKHIINRKNQFGGSLNNIIHKLENLYEDLKTPITTNTETIIRRIFELRKNVDEIVAKKTSNVINQINVAYDTTIAKEGQYEISTRFNKIIGPTMIDVSQLRRYEEKVNELEQKIKNIIIDDNLKKITHDTIREVKKIVNEYTEANNKIKDELGMLTMNNNKLDAYFNKHNFVKTEYDNVNVLSLTDETRSGSKSVASATSKDIKQEKKYKKIEWIETIYNPFTSSDASIITNMEDLFKQKSVERIGTLQNELQKYKDELGIKKQQFGGSLSEFLDETSKLLNLKTEYRLNFENYKEEFIRYVELYNDIYAYVEFLVSGLIKNIYKTEYNNFVNINKSYIVFYLRCLKKLQEFMETSDPTAQLYRKKYKITVNHIICLFEYLLSGPVGLTIETYIGITQCTGKFKNGFILFNLFKEICEEYYTKNLPKLGIYLRVNTFPSFEDDRHKYFYSIQDDKRMNQIFRGKKKIKEEVLEYKYVDNTKTTVYKQSAFNEVFGAEVYNNAVMSKAMALPTKLSKKTSLCMMTNGYSGTGKTYTLFGSDSLDGIVHSTVKDITGLYKLYFRVYEIYGKAVPYTFYFNDPTELSHCVYWHSLSPDGNTLTEHRIDGRVMGDEFVNKNVDDKYRDKQIFYEIGIDKINQFFENLKTISKKIDKKREDGIYMDSQTPAEKFTRRIRHTVNNPISSRSILIYDLRLYVGDTTIEHSVINSADEVKFLIIDMPGRENLYDTYVKPYIGSPTMMKIICNDDNGKITKLNMILTIMNLNPLYMGFFHGELIVDHINKNANEILKMYYDGITLRISNEKKIIDYIVNYERNYTIGSFFNLEQNGEIKLKSSKPPPPEGRVQAFLYDYDDQYYSLLALFIMYNLILARKFDIIVNLFQMIIDLEINNVIDRIINAKNFSGVVTGLKNENSNIGRRIGDSYNLESVKKCMKYDYVGCALEATYINENISGLFYGTANELLCVNCGVEKRKETQEKIDNTFKEQKINMIEHNVVAYRSMLQCANGETYPEATTQIITSNISDGFNSSVAKYELQINFVNKINRMFNIDNYGGFTSYLYDSDDINLEKIQCDDVIEQMRDSSIKVCGITANPKKIPIVMPVSVSKDKYKDIYELKNKKCTIRESDKMLFKYKAPDFDTYINNCRLYGIIYPETPGSHTPTYNYDLMLKHIEFFKKQYDPTKLFNKREPLIKTLLQNFLKDANYDVAILHIVANNGKPPEEQQKLLSEIESVLALLSGVGSEEVSPPSRQENFDALL